jgi:probable HAF family extracellular repeat protein
MLNTIPRAKLHDLAPLAPPANSLTTFAAKFALMCALAIPTIGLGQGHHHYKLIDVGTLGGPSSNVAVAQIVTNHGTLVGAADTTTPDPNLPCLPCQSSFITHAFQWRDGVLTDLGALPGTNSSATLWTSNSGLSTGYSEVGFIDPLLGVPAIHAVLWRDGHIEDLGTLEGGYESLAFTVNSRGQVAGVSQNLVPDPFFILKTQSRTFLWEKGKMRDLGTLGGSSAGLLGFDGNVEMNERGHIVACSDTSKVNPATGFPVVEPFLWEPDTMISLGSFGGTAGCPTSINNRDQVVGYSNLAGDGSNHPFLWERGRPLVDLGTLGGPNGIAFWINEPGEVVGDAGVASPPGCLHAFLWRQGVMTDLGTIPGTDCSDGAVINSRSQVVGASFTSDFSVFDAFLWENGSMADLNSLVSVPSAVHLFQGADINDRGEIAVRGFLPNGDIRAFLLIPCDENHPDIEGCDYSPVEVSTVAASHATEPQKQLTPQEISRIHALLMKRGRGIMPGTIGIGR